MTDPAAIAVGLSPAQRDIMLGHMVEITPEESQQLEDMGLKGKMTFEYIRVRKMTWPITKAGLAVRAALHDDTVRGEGEK